MLRDEIAARLEQAFSELGFAEPGVAQLKTASEVSLRTLYKHFPSKEAMVVGALEHRHQRYLTLLRGNSPLRRDEYPAKAIEQVFDELEQWMLQYAPNGCMSTNARAAFPDNTQIDQAVRAHKEEVRHLLGQLSQNEALGTALFLLHEGVSSSWPLMGDAAITAAKSAALTLLQEDPS